MSEGGFGMACSRPDHPNQGLLAGPVGILTPELNVLSSRVGLATTVVGSSERESSNAPASEDPPKSP